jgi:hypothetical protein
MTRLALRAIPGKFVAAVDNAVSENRTRDLLTVLAVWLLLAVTLIFLARSNTSVPGLYYDEAHCAGMAKDFLTGHPHLHMPGHEVINVCGRPFPTFVQFYGGALKSWLLLPSFAVFGASQPVLRLTALGWGLMALLLFMLWTWRWLGRNTALLAGTLLAMDPTFFFISVLDWGPVIPSLLCRFACFYFALRWWQTRRAPGRRGFFFAVLVGLFAGLGFFNKMDFVVLLAGVLLALLCCNVRLLWTYLVLRQSAPRRPPLSMPASSLALACLGFCLTAGPMLAHLPTMLNADKPGGEPGELNEKFNAMLAMYDGSYFYRLMDAGGLFDKMYLTRPPIFAPIGLALLLAAAYLIGTERLRNFFLDPFFSLVSFFRGSSGHAAAFLLLAILFITAGIFLLKGAVRIHHMVAVYPFPHLVVALAVTRLWRRSQGEGLISPARSVLSPSSLGAALFALLLASQLLALYRTQQLIRQTGGRGWWSDALSKFARQVKDRSDMTIVSLDWGFSEQLAFLTDGPTLAEPFWSKDHPSSTCTNCIYLAHPTDYRLYEFEPAYLESARRSGLDVIDVRPWKDHQDQTAFFSLRLGKK